jgi:hypothetical protein
MLIQVGDAPLGMLMLRIAGRYARLTQKKLHTTGHLFEKRYHALLRPLHPSESGSCSHGAEAF